MQVHTRITESSSRRPREKNRYSSPEQFIINSLVNNLGADFVLIADVLNFNPLTKGVIRTPKEVGRLSNLTG